MKAEQKVECILLEYEREAPAYTYRGCVSSAPGGMDTGFQGLDFTNMMEFVAVELRKFPDKRLVLKRKEAPFPMAMPPGIEQLLRVDFETAIKSLSLPPQTIDLRTPKSPHIIKSQPLLGQLRHGVDTLADALGEEVYIKLKSRPRSVLAEDPESGRWRELSPSTGSLPTIGDLQLTSQIFIGSSHWATVKVQDLLDLKYPRYWLPRSWNRNRGWITHDELVEMYETYKKEKTHVESSTGGDHPSQPGQPT